MKVLGINAIYHDPAAALVVDGRIVAAAEEEGEEGVVSLAAGILLVAGLGAEDVDLETVQ